MAVNIEQDTPIPVIHGVGCERCHIVHPLPSCIRCRSSMVYIDYEVDEWQCLACGQSWNRHPTLSQVEQQEIRAAISDGRASPLIEACGPVKRGRPSNHDRVVEALNHLHVATAHQIAFWRTNGMSVSAVERVLVLMASVDMVSHKKHGDGQVYWRMMEGGK